MVVTSQALLPPPPNCVAVPQAAQNALIHAAKFLGWQQLQRLASEREIWMIADCLVRIHTFQPFSPTSGPVLLWQKGREAALWVPPPPCCSLQLQKRDRDAEQYLKQTVLHLHSPQAAVREAAVRFLGESRSQCVPIPLPPPPSECCGFTAQGRPWGITGEPMVFLGVIEATLGSLGHYGARWGIV